MYLGIYGTRIPGSQRLSSAISIEAPCSTRSTCSCPQFRVLSTVLTIQRRLVDLSVQKRYPFFSERCQATMPPHRISGGQRATGAPPCATRSRGVYHCCRGVPDHSLRRSVLLGTLTAAGFASDWDSPANAADEGYTGKAYITIGMCPQIFRNDRTIGDKSALCSDAMPLGRIVFGLFGDTAPGTIASFTNLLQKGAYTGTTFHKVIPGRYIKAGRQGQRRYGEIDINKTEGLPPNPDMVSSKAFNRSHLRPGTLSWCVGESDDPDYVRSRSGYESAEFLITTGPGPALDLDGTNVVFGQVIEGFDVLQQMGAVPTIKPNDTLTGFNQMAQFFGDDRAAKARDKWDKPLQSLVITDAGLI